MQQSQGKLGIVNHENSELTDLKWKPSQKMYWLKSSVYKQLNSAKGKLYESSS